MNGFPRIYRSFADFERDELRKLDGLHSTVEDLLDDCFAEELGLEEAIPQRKRKQATWD